MLLDSMPNARGKYTVMYQGWVTSLIFFELNMFFLSQISINFEILYKSKFLLLKICKFNYFYQILLSLFDILNIFYDNI